MKLRATTFPTPFLDHDSATTGRIDIQKKTSTGVGTNSDGLLHVVALSWSRKGVGREFVGCNVIF